MRMAGRIGEDSHNCAHRSTERAAVPQPPRRPAPGGHGQPQDVLRPDVNPCTRHEPLDSRSSGGHSPEPRRSPWRLRSAIPNAWAMGTKSPQERFQGSPAWMARTSAAPPPPKKKTPRGPPRTDAIRLRTARGIRNPSSDGRCPPDLQGASAPGAARGFRSVRSSFPLSRALRRAARIPLPLPGRKLQGE